MARIPYPDPNDLSDETREYLERLVPLNIFRMLAHSPHLMKPFVSLGTGFLYKGKIDPIMREIAILRVGYLSNARYETAQHEKIGRELGMSDELIEAIKIGADAFGLTIEQRLVIAFVDDLLINVKAGDATLLPIVETFGAQGAQELTLVTGYYMMVCRFLETFGVDIEDGGAKGLKLPGTTQ